MASFIFSCPQCGRPMEVQEEWIGMEAKCPHCGQSITIAKPEQHPAPAAVEQSVGEDEKSCPFCGQMIKKEAIFCKHCKKSLVEPKKIKVTCQYCAEEVEIPETRQGNTVCPSCGQTISVCHGGTQGNRPQTVQLSAVSSDSPSAADEKPCPLCGKMINAKAEFCRFCQKDISQAGTFKVTCPKCSEPFDVDYSMDCKKVPCPFCGAEFRPVSQKSRDRKFALCGCSLAGSTLLISMFCSVLLGLLPCIAGIVVSGIALAKFGNHPDERLKKYALLGIGANIAAVLLAWTISMAVLSALR